MLRIFHFKQIIAIVLVMAFSCQGFQIPQAAAQLSLPSVGASVPFSSHFQTPLMRAIKIFANDPMKFDFIIDQGDEKSQVTSHRSQVNDKNESEKLIKYFLTALTIPQGDLWVNLSPYEKERIVPDELGKTQMGRDLLAQDYILKQITANLMHPDSEIGKQFWAKIYKQAAKRYGTTQVPINTFNKVWIVPDKAEIFEKSQVTGHKSQESTNQAIAYVTKATLKVMLEEDYLTKEKNNRRQPGDMTLVVSPSPLPNDNTKVGENVPGLNSSRNGHKFSNWQNQIIKEIIIPELERQVNEGEEFAPLRQIYHSVILATWYKKRIKDGIIAQQYVDQKKIQGTQYETSLFANRQPGDQVTSHKSPDYDIEQIYQLYLKSFKKGAYNFVRDDLDESTGQSVPRKYFSGGALLKDVALTTQNQIPSTPQQAKIVHVTMGDRSMTIEDSTFSNVQIPDSAVTALNDIYDVNTRQFKPKGIDAIFQEAAKDSGQRIVISGGMRYLMSGDRKDVDVIFLPQEDSSDVVKYLTALDAILRRLSVPDHMTIELENWHGWIVLVIKENNEELRRLIIDMQKPPYRLEVEAKSPEEYILETLRLNFNAFAQDDYTQDFFQHAKEFIKSYIAALYYLGVGDSQKAEWEEARQKYLNNLNENKPLPEFFTLKQKQGLLTEIMSLLNNKAQEVEILARIKHRLALPLGDADFSMTANPSNPNPSISSQARLASTYTRNNRHSSLDQFLIGVIKHLGVEHFNHSVEVGIGNQNAPTLFNWANTFLGVNPNARITALDSDIDVVRDAQNSMFLQVNLIREKVSIFHGVFGAEGASGFFPANADIFRMLNVLQHYSHENQRILRAAALNQVREGGLYVEGDDFFYFICQKRNGNFVPIHIVIDSKDFFDVKIFADFINRLVDLFPLFEQQIRQEIDGKDFGADYTKRDIVYHILENVLLARTIETDQSIKVFSYNNNAVPLSSLSDNVILTHPYNNPAFAAIYEQLMSGFPHQSTLHNRIFPKPHFNNTGDSGFLYESELGEFDPPKTLGDSAVFLGGNCAVCLSNSIIFAANHAFTEDSKAFEAFLPTPGVWVIEELTLKVKSLENHLKDLETDGQDIMAFLSKVFSDSLGNPLNTRLTEDTQIVLQISGQKSQVIYEANSGVVKHTITIHVLRPSDYAATSRFTPIMLATAMAMAPFAQHTAYAIKAPKSSGIENQTNVLASIKSQFSLWANDKRLVGTDAQSAYSDFIAIFGEKRLAVAQMQNLQIVFIMYAQMGKQPFARMVNAFKTIFHDAFLDFLIQHPHAIAFNDPNNALELQKLIAKTQGLAQNNPVLFKAFEQNIATANQINAQDRNRIEQIVKSLDLTRSTDNPDEQVLKDNDTMRVFYLSMTALLPLWTPVTVDQYRTMMLYAFFYPTVLNGKGIDGYYFGQDEIANHSREALSMLVLQEIAYVWLNQANFHKPDLVAVMAGDPSFNQSPSQWLLKYVLSRRAATALEGFLGNSSQGLMRQLDETYPIAKETQWPNYLSLWEQSRHIKNAIHDVFHGLDQKAYDAVVLDVLGAINTDVARPFLVSSVIAQYLQGQGKKEVAEEFLGLMKGGADRLITKEEIIRVLKRVLQQANTDRPDVDGAMMAEIVLPDGFTYLAPEENAIQLERILEYQKSNWKEMMRRFQMTAYDVDKGKVNDIVDRYVNHVRNNMILVKGPDPDRKLYFLKKKRSFPNNVIRNDYRRELFSEKVMGDRLRHPEIIVTPNYDAYLTRVIDQSSFIDQGVDPSKEFAKIWVFHVLMHIYDHWFRNIAFAASGPVAIDSDMLDLMDRGYVDFIEYHTAFLSHALEHVIIKDLENALTPEANVRLIQSDIYSYLGAYKPDDLEILKTHFNAFAISTNLHQALQYMELLTPQDVKEAIRLFKADMNFEQMLKDSGFSNEDTRRMAPYFKENQKYLGKLCDDFWEILYGSRPGFSSLDHSMTTTGGIDLNSVDEALSTRGASGFAFEPSSMGFATLDHLTPEITGIEELRSLPVFLEMAQ